MKKLSIIIFCILTSITGYGQIELKGITLGEVNESKEVFKTTLGGLEGYITVRSLTDGRICQIIFSLPNRSDKISEEKEIYIRESLEKKFGIRYTKPPKSMTPTYANFFRKKGGVMYEIQFRDYGVFSDLYYDYRIYISDIKLMKIREKERKEEQPEDF